MSKNQLIHECSKCGAQSSKWQGRCSECGAWGTIKEITNDKLLITNKNTAPSAELIDFTKIVGQNILRKSTGISEVDRVLGGGIVPGSIILLGGQPGIGKSTLVLQIASKISSTVIASPVLGAWQSRGKNANATSSQASRNDNLVIYNSGEESGEQIKLRFDRLGLKTNNIKYLGETDIDTICETIKKNKPALAIIDSIQTITVRDVESAVGGVTQIKAATAKLMELAKQNNIPIIIIGHITKDGDIAGPKTLEHMVDAVLYFEGERLSNYRILRSHKNRFGNTNEIGVFEMDENGLEEITNPSAVFLEDRSEASGSVITSVLEGTRPFLVEVQALTNPTQFGYPLRKASGFDINRLNIISTILAKRANIASYSSDIILNIAGGIKITDTAADLAVALAIISSIKNKPLPKNAIAFGELGLGGEIRKVGQLQKRIEEAKRMGFTEIISPEKYKYIGDVMKKF